MFIYGKKKEKQLLLYANMRAPRSNFSDDSNIRSVQSICFDIA